MGLTEFTYHGHVILMVIPHFRVHYVMIRSVSYTVSHLGSKGKTFTLTSAFSEDCYPVLHFNRNVCSNAG